MKIVRDIEDIEKLNLCNTAVALGKFDGVHRGHRVILDELCHDKIFELTPVIFTFSGNPRNRNQNMAAGEKKIFTEEEQMLVYEKLGIDIVIVCRISSDILNMTPEEFVQEILVKRLRAKKVVCGENFRFGNARMGSADTLKILGEKNGFSTHVIPLVTIGDTVISSTLIRKLILEGKMEEAAKMLGHPFTVVGRVVHGNKIGRTMDTPTANILPDKDKILPPNGVYNCRCKIDGREYFGMTNIGCKPTVTSEKPVIGVETFFLDFQGDLYGKILELELFVHTRPEKKFNSIDQLKKQLESDKENCRIWSRRENKI